MKSIDKFVLVLVASLALLLAGCGGGSSSTPDEPEMTGPTPEEMAAERMAAQRSALETANSALSAALTPLVGATPTQAQIDAANTAIGALQAALTNAADLSDADKAPYQTAVTNAMASVTRAELALQVAEEEAQEEAAKALRAMARKLYGGLTQEAADNSLSAAGFASFSTSPSRVTMDVDGDTTATTDDQVTLRQSTATPTAITGWSGADYKSSASADNTDHVVIYNNRGTTSSLYTAKWGPHTGTATTERPAAGILENTTRGRILPAILAEADVHNQYIAGSGFPSVGTKTHTTLAGATASVSGTFDGVPGTYTCTHPCTSAKAASGIDLTGMWYFTPTSVTAMTSTPESVYQVFGWWSREDATGTDVDVKAFVGEVVPAGGTSDRVTTDSTPALQGTATYTGGAVGKVAIYNPLGDHSVAGAFTADATLNVNFTRGNISGELSNFMAGGNSVDWSVSLEEDDSIVYTDATHFGVDAAGTAWTIGGTAAPKSGQWGGNFYDRNSGGIPDTAAGTFSSAYRNIGHMVGAFGTTLEE